MVMPWLPRRGFSGSRETVEYAASGVHVSQPIRSPLLVFPVEISGGHVCGEAGEDLGGRREEMLWHRTRECFEGVPLRGLRRRRRHPGVQGGILGEVERRLTVVDAWCCGEAQEKGDRGTVSADAHA
jgi:hypothetical protein